MAEVTIICPGCKKSFTLKASNLSVLNGKIFTCPRCRLQTPFSRLLPADRPELHTHIASGAPGADLHTHIGGIPVGPIGNKTQIANNPGSGNGFATLIVQQPYGRTIPLQPGTHTLGRDSSDSRASVRIAPDPYMSRFHARLDLGMTPGGKMARISSLNPNNPVLINGKRINSPTGVQINSGDYITLGETQMIIRL